MTHIAATPARASQLLSAMTTLEATLLGQVMGEATAMQSFRLPVVIAAVVTWLCMVELGATWWRPTIWLVAVVSAGIWGGFGFLVADALRLPLVAPIAAAVSGTAAAYIRISRHL